METMTLLAPATGSSGYRALTDQVREAGLLEPRVGREMTRIVFTTCAFAGGWVALLVVHGTWAALATAAYLGVASTQVVFIGHDAGHRQIFASRQANRAVGLVVGNLLTGLSFGWWVPKHAAHHGHPNQVGRDPDIAPGVIAFVPETAVTNSRGRRAFLRWQGALLFPLMSLEGVSMRIASGQSIRRRRDGSRLIEALLIVAHFAAYLALVFVALPPLRALAFIAVQQAVLGLYLGCSFAPNHVGMPTLEQGAVTTFAYRQVVTARNIRGGAFISFLFGGLDLQIEHHLFPTIPRCNLRQVQPLVREFCAREGLPYTEEGLVESYANLVRYVWAIGRGRPAAAAVAPQN
ncbi:MAG TPA: acyl-CoA desaturase [Acidimicrobiales bacterium]|nr:acyl-CoA desaturase [Acidimicrobiales bacterium]